MAKTKRRCIFCGARADSYEHVFPDWINKLIETEGVESVRFDVADGAVEQVSSHPAKHPASLRAKIVCARCNHGWMSDLETVASGLLGPMMTGQPTVLDMPQQLLAAAWAVKLAMVGETIQYRANAFSQDDRDLMREQRRPPLHAHVSIAAFSLDTPNMTRYTRGLGKVHRNGAPFSDLYVHTIQVLHVIFSVRGTTTFPATDNRSLEHIAEPHHFEIPVFPPVEQCRWPPNLVMDEAMFMEYSGGNNLATGP